VPGLGLLTVMTEPVLPVYSPVSGFAAVIDVPKTSEPAPYLEFVTGAPG
jgi:hypothetical protein